MELITDSLFAERKIAEVNHLVIRRRALPEPVLTEGFSKFLVIDADEIFVDFFERIQNCMQAFGESVWTFAVIDPDPELYFYHHFRKYPIFDVTAADSAEDFRSITTADPGESPADAIAFNGVITVAYPVSQRWVVYADQDHEIGIIGFKDRETMKVFSSAYGQDRLFSMAEALPNLLSVTHNNAIPADLGAELLKNYGG